MNEQGRFSVMLCYLKVDDDEIPTLLLLDGKRHVTGGLYLQTSPQAEDKFGSLAPPPGLK